MHWVLGHLLDPWLLVQSLWDFSHTLSPCPLVGWQEHIICRALGRLWTCAVQSQGWCFEYASNPGRDIVQEFIFFRYGSDMVQKTTKTKQITLSKHGRQILADPENIICIFQIFRKWTGSLTGTLNSESAFIKISLPNFDGICQVINSNHS